MKIQVNGDSLEVREGLSLAELVDELELTGKRLAAEVNNEIIPRSQHAETQLAGGDKVEIVHAIGGG